MIYPGNDLCLSEFTLVLMSYYGACWEYEFELVG
jgi:hypothetical protein